jgi:hypothetical protein
MIVSATKALRHTYKLDLAEAPGFEPELHESKSCVQSHYTTPQVSLAGIEPTYLL